MEAKIYYKQVAVIQGKYFSVHDPNVEYEIGKEMQEKPKPRHKGGFFVYPTKELAASAEIANRIGSNWIFPRSVLKVMCWGDHIAYPRFKLCFEYLKPIKDLGFPKRYLAQNLSFGSESFENDLNNESSPDSPHGIKNYSNLKDPQVLTQDINQCIELYQSNYEYKEEKQTYHRLNLNDLRQDLLGKQTYSVEKVQQSIQNKSKGPKTRTHTLKAETKQLELEVLEMERKARKMGINV